VIAAKAIHPQPTSLRPRMKGGRLNVAGDRIVSIEPSHAAEDRLRPERHGRAAPSHEGE
jgi:hypothetical protein